MEPIQSPSHPSAGAAAPTVVLSGTAQLLASVPHLLGYHPRRSLVVLACGPVDADAPGASAPRAPVRCTARQDLPDVKDAAASVGVLAEPLVRAGREAGGPLLVHAFVHDGDPGEVEAVAAAVRALVRRTGHTLHELVHVVDGRYRSLLASRTSAGPAPDESGDDWRPVPDAADVPAVADLVLQGRSPLGSREEVAARVRQRDEAAATATGLALTLLELAPESCDVEDALTRLGRWVVHGEDEPAARDRARIVRVLADRTVRDAVLARWLPGLCRVEDVLPADGASRLRRAVPPWPRRDAAPLDRLLRLAGQVPTEDAVPLLTLAGGMAWDTGEGTVANEAIDLALETDPAYRMAQLLRAALDAGLPPLGRSADVA
ncbi:hypothetical protein GCM10009584_23100 [Ornithinimicrobium humiphilum]|uniref:Uncharacterized protein DUF4192 n=1 Tax=Ornithinimicrobium humiphilum TaxID=125288 RepID=A0A543KMU2_9MICO|nr:DUF4192 domain-containing protein [Ornithinimicrobium humiphilum]TQM96397.1 uncharacterized protein DUF4192 [Ornithinimicrobium humiphilum]